MKIVALDLGKFNSAVCYFDSKTRKATFTTVATRQDYLNSVFARYDADLVVMEACGPSGWIKDLAQSHALKTLVCSTNEEAWRWANVKRKTDKDDAFKLARMAAMGELRGVHVPSPGRRCGTTRGPRGFTKESAASRRLARRRPRSRWLVNFV